MREKNRRIGVWVGLGMLMLLLLTTISGSVSAQCLWSRSGTDTYLANSGDNVGIGISTPANKLDVSGNMAVGSNFVGTSAPADGMIIEGKVGIGTSGPDAWLEINQPDVNSPAIRLSYNDNDGTANDYVEFLVDSNGNLEISTDGYNNAIWIDDVNLRVGIGTEVVNSFFTIHGDSATMDLETADSTIVNGEDIGTIEFRGLDDTIQHLVGAMIRAEAAGTWGGSDVDDAPTELQFFTEDDTTTDNLGTPRMVISATGNVGIGTTEPQGALNIDNTGESKGLGVSFDTYHVQTTGAGATTIATISTDNDEAYGLTVTVVGMKNDGSWTAHYVRHATFENDGGTLSAVGAVSSAHTAEDRAAWDVTFVISSTDILVKVTGEATTTIEWQSTVEKHIVGI